jgi:xanthine dehydrogenase YagS FAD-binding subunit
MKRFEHYNARTIDEAIWLLKRFNGEAVINAGGTDLINVLKDDIIPRYPRAVINIKTIPGLESIREQGETIHIGALVKLQDIATSSIITEKYSVLAEAAQSVGPPQIRYVSTLGGDLCQNVHCWYYRASKWTGRTFICRRKGGNFCYAISGDNRFHSIFGAPKGCYAVYPSALGIALIALNAVAKTTKRLVSFETFFDAISGTVLEADEIITGIEVPAPVSTTKSSYLSFSPRRVLRFPIVSCATAVKIEDGVVDNARIVLGAVAPVPYRARAAEDYLNGKAINEKVALKAGEEAVKEARPLRLNGYKVHMGKVLVVRTLQAFSHFDWPHQCSRPRQTSQPEARTKVLQR